MALNANEVKGTGTVYETMDAGTYPARLVGVVDLGLQAQRPYLGKDKPPAREIALTYEFVDEFLKDEDGEPDPAKPRWLTEMLPFFNLQATRAKSTARYNSIDPKNVHEGDWSKLVNTPLNVTVVINPGTGKNQGRNYENIGGVAPVREKDVAKFPPLVNDVFVFDLDNPDLDVFKSLPKFIQEKVKSNLEYEGSPLEKLLGKDPAPPKTETKKGTPAKAALKVEDEEDEIPY